mmetsp:Transcript_7362/g.10802  ORF Transcript_7362/g.10802 Transcript_7362/m.10802 type:complete len:152 (-) Transcript_7362:1825-2280(-)
MDSLSFGSRGFQSQLLYCPGSPEMESGIPLLNNQGDPIRASGRQLYSQQAAKVGVLTTTASRAILQTPVYLVPPLLLETITPLHTYMVEHSSIPLTTFLLLTSFGFGLPAAVAIFPQRGRISSQDVEPKFRSLIDPATNQPYKEFYYNKGL